METTKTKNLMLRVTEEEKDLFDKMRESYGLTQRELFINMMKSYKVENAEKYKSSLELIEKYQSGISAVVTQLIADMEADKREELLKQNKKQEIFQEYRKQALEGQQKLTKFEQQIDTLTGQNNTLMEMNKTLEFALNQLRREKEAQK